MLIIISFPVVTPSILTSHNLKRMPFRILILGTHYLQITILKKKTGQL